MFPTTWFVKMHIRLCQALDAVFVSPSPTQGQICWQHRFLCWLFSLLITKMSASSLPRAVNPFLGLTAHWRKWFSSENKQFGLSILFIWERILRNYLWKKKLFVMRQVCACHEVCSRYWSTRGDTEKKCLFTNYRMNSAIHSFCTQLLKIIYM